MALRTCREKQTLSGKITSGGGVHQQGQGKGLEVPAHFILQNSSNRYAIGFYLQAKTKSTSFLLALMGRVAGPGWVPCPISSSTSTGLRAWDKVEQRNRELQRIRRLKQEFPPELPFWMSPYTSTNDTEVPINQLQGMRCLDIWEVRWEREWNGWGYRAGFNHHIPCMWRPYALPKLCCGDCNKYKKSLAPPLSRTDKIC